MTRTLLLALFLACLPSTAAAQSGGLFLLVPFGARAVGQGEAVVADTTLGTEGIWWNPAATARNAKREFGIHHSKTVIATSDMLAFSLPSELLGTLSGAFYFVNYGDLPATDPFTGSQTGTITNRNYLLALSYAATIGRRLSAGLTYKFVMLRFNCSGFCGEIPVLSGSTSAIDLGVQYNVPFRLPLTVGASLRNVGPDLQVKDREQRDPLPKLIQVGARARIPVASLDRSGGSLEVMADVKKASELGSGAFSVGAVLGYREEFFLRAGYLSQPGEGDGPSIGVGASRGSLTVDISRRFDALSSQLGETPTYVAVRLRF